MCKQNKETCDEGAKLPSSNIFQIRTLCWEILNHKFSVYVILNIYHWVSLTDWVLWIAENIEIKWNNTAPLNVSRLIFIISHDGSGWRDLLEWWQLKTIIWMCFTKIN